MRADEPRARARQLGARVMGRLDALARFSSDKGALTRLYLTPEHKAAALQVQAGWARPACSPPSTQSATSSAVTRASKPGLPALLLGSHIDTVRNAGKYDGNLGVIAAIEAVAELHGSSGACRSRSRCWALATRRACASR